MKKTYLDLSALLLGVSVMIMVACSKQDDSKENALKGTDKGIKMKQANPASNTQDHLPRSQQKPVTMTVEPLRFGNGYGAIDAQLKQQLGDRNASPAETLSRITEMWRSTWVPSFDQPLGSSNSNPPNLPDIFKSLSPDATSFIEMLRDNKAPYLSTVEEKEAGYAIAVLSTLAAMSDGDELSSILSSRANFLPISKGDLVVYMALSDAVKSIPPTAAIENWIEMTESSNPVYRLIALEAGARAQPSIARTVSQEYPKAEELSKINAAKLSFYERYTNETDPVIVSKLIDAVSRIGTKEAQSTLKLIRERQAKLGASDILQQADQAIEQVGKLIKAQSPNP